MNSITEPIILVSTRTIDLFPLPGGAVEEIPGGPATYTGQALRRLGVPYRLITGQSAIVEVVILPSGDQEYVIPQLPLIPLPERFSAPATILSPIMREIDPLSVPQADGLLVIDLQGFVREPNTLTDHVRQPVDLEALISRASVVKASVSELKRLTPNTLAALEGTALVMTEGASGAWVVTGGRRDHVPSHPTHARHTIGAGDSFLACLVCEMLAGRDVLEATRAASRFTAEVLQSREIAERASES